MTKAEKLIGTITDLAKLQGKIFAKSKSKVTINLVTHTIKQTNSHTQQSREESVHTEGNVYRRLIRHTIQLHTYSEIFVARFERVHIFRSTFLEHLSKKNRQTNSQPFIPAEGVVVAAAAAAKQLLKKVTLSSKQVLDKMCLKEMGDEYCVASRTRPLFPQNEMKQQKNSLFSQDCAVLVENVRRELGKTLKKIMSL